MPSGAVTNLGALPGPTMFWPPALGAVSLSVAVALRVLASRAIGPLLLCHPPIMACGLGPSNDMDPIFLLTESSGRRRLRRDDDLRAGGGEFPHNLSICTGISDHQI
jgi:hypothetical protein